LLSADREALISVSLAGVLSNFGVESLISALLSYSFSHNIIYHYWQPLHRLYVVASDKPEVEEPLSSIATVEVHVVDVNDNAPRIRVNAPGVQTGTGNGNTTLWVERGAPSGTFVGHVNVEVT